MSEFTNNLQEISNRVAREFRAFVTSEEPSRRYREMRQEAHFVAEVYHQLRSVGYLAGECYMEYNYKKNKKERHRPDLIYEHNESDEVAEFTVLWDEEVYFGKSEPTGGAWKNKINDHWDRLLEYSKASDNIATLTLVVAYVGPVFLRNGSEFNLEVFKKSIETQLELAEHSKPRNGISFGVVSC